ncbi:hypothetical protein LX15_003125 [Streptoalloteichus tenebrarius]|uniref:Uncharacterized protein n=1 Tax=Streptoalloteichus tenebrarius (strain ATCC 17920 / DSM 40477 / JCM 4838 / CBS 697.72 / NBRC 16177 / NCIMB 11028 / NRRL B-12390 / A12253. 1 / ISP 5477) TaxID=1933 RepID=A0ABT1HV80_STRSD|nr:hypothetical protein [Streptoalloteichus tenebrarius]MCP2259424.1 hypothetical protein [Streptoalloteichus tenebrarius]BFF02366.1 hypothetical protein GCM10020241_40410 [Streptoalloteichus tenebrarius]
MTLVERLVAPGASRGEVVASFGAAGAGAVAALALTLHAGLPLLAVVVVALVAFDLFGGAVVNATHSAKRWYHREGRTNRHHLVFVAVHVQPFLLALVVPGLPWTTAATVYAVSLASAVAVVCAPDRSRRPVAFGVTALALTVVTALTTVPAAISWFAPVMLVKLLLSHLLPEEATRDISRSAPVGAP